ncbi:hypothetical protein F4775DRAFT_603814 [Biscogniauxia sp. FL1348]|nr:hypothetical protein F4775DRAFT_603814 [Biscogniauxia sp. FL1348]
MSGLDTLQRMILTPWMYDRVPEIGGGLGRPRGEIDTTPDDDVLTTGRGLTRRDRSTKDSLALFLAQVHACAYCSVGGLKLGVVCSGCGPRAMIRYCSIECLLVDTTHQAYVCSHPGRVEMFPHPIQLHGLPPAYRRLLPAIPLPPNASKALFRQRAFVSTLADSTAWLYPLAIAHQKVHKNCAMVSRQQKKLTRADWVVFEEKPTCGSLVDALFVITFPDADGRSTCCFRRLRNAAMCTQDPSLVEALGLWILDMVLTSASPADRDRWGEIFVRQFGREFVSCSHVVARLATPLLLESSQRHPFIAEDRWDLVENAVAAAETLEPLLYMASKGGTLSEDQLQAMWDRAGPGWTGHTDECMSTPLAMAYHWGPYRIWVPTRPWEAPGRYWGHAQDSDDSDNSDGSDNDSIRSENGDSSVADSAEGSTGSSPGQDSGEPVRGKKRRFSDLSTDNDADDEGETFESDEEMYDQDDQDDQDGQDDSDSDSDDADGALVVRTEREAQNGHSRKKQKLDLSSEEESESAASIEQPASGSILQFTPADDPPRSYFTLGYRALYLSTGLLSTLSSLNRGSEGGTCRIIYPEALFARLEEVYSSYGNDEDDEGAALYRVVVVDTRREQPYNVIGEDGGRGGGMTLELATEHALDVFRAHFENSDGADFATVYNHAGSTIDLWRETKVLSAIDEDDATSALTWTLGEDGLLALAVVEDEHCLAVSVL